MAKRNNILKALAGSSWGQTKEVMSTTYKAIGKSLASYASQIWAPLVSETNWDILQRQQNGALRIITGNVKIAGETHLHNETEMLPVKEHGRMLSKQHVLSMQREKHPNHATCTKAKKPPRDMRKTMFTEFKQEIKDLVLTDKINEAEYRHNLKKIHTTTVTKALEEQEPSKVLLTPTPSIAKEEKELPRSARVRLSQLRSGYCPMWNYYLARINRSDTNLCPDCKTEVHDTVHLFNCTANPTTLTPTDLWTNPVQVAYFLKLIDGAGDGEIDPG